AAGRRRADCYAVWSSYPESVPPSILAVVALGMMDGAAVSTVWDALGDRINPVLDRPKLQSGVVARRLSTARGEEYFIVKNPATRTYVRLTPDEHYLLALMDGNHQVKDLVLAYFSKYRRLAPRRVLHLVDELRGHRFLTEPPGTVWEGLSA